MRRITLTLALLAAALVAAGPHPSQAAAAAHDVKLHTGDLVAFTDGHLGYVETVNAHSFVTVEANALHSVVERTHPRGSGRVVNYTTPAGRRTLLAIVTRHDLLPLHVGSAGPNVGLLQFLIRDPRPKANVFREVKGTLSKQPTFYFGIPTGKAVYAYKWRLGYPKKWNVEARPVVGRYFLDLLTGKRKRPAAWVALAGSRLKAIEAATPSVAAVKWKTLLQTWAARPIYETSSNRGPCISYSCIVGGRSITIQASTGAFGAAWCVSTQQEASLIVTGHTFADRTAGVFYAAGWAARRNLLHAKPKVGAIVTFMDGQGHMGFVVKITSAGFVSIEGNASNRVLERFHTFGDRRPAYIYLPGVA